MGQENIAELIARVRIPILIKCVPNRTPGKTGKVALEEYVVCIFVHTTHRASTIGRPIPFSDVVRGWEAVPKQLPKENFYF